MKSIVIYKSKTGFTEKYAKWIAGELRCDISSYDKALKGDLNNYDLIIYGGGLYAGKIGGLKKIKGIIAENSKGKLIVFATGATPVESEDVISTTWKGNFTEEELKTIPHFYMQSGLNYEKMGFFDRMMMKAFSKMLNKKEDKTSEEAGTQLAITASHDISSKKYIEPLIQYVKNKKQ